MYPMRDLTSSGWVAISYPPTLAAPFDGDNNPHSIRIVVDFPAPFGPKNPNTSPRLTRKLTWSTATKLTELLRQPFCNDCIRTISWQFRCSLNLLVCPPISLISPTAFFNRAMLVRNQLQPGYVSALLAESCLCVSNSALDVRPVFIFLRGHAIWFLACSLPPNATSTFSLAVWAK